MGLSIELVDELSRLEALRAEWIELARAGGDSPFFRGPGWLLPWFRSFGPTMEAKLHVVAGWDGTKLVGLAPCYERTARMGPGVKLTEVRLLGDAGARPPAVDILVAPGNEERFAGAL